MEPVYAQFLDPVESLEVVAERLEVGGCEVLAEVNKQLTAVWQQPMGGDPGQHLNRDSLSVSPYVSLLLSESKHLPVLLRRQV